MKFSIIVEGKIKSFHEKGRLRKFMTARSGLQRAWEEVRDSLEKDQHTQETTGTNNRWWEDNSLNKRELNDFQMPQSPIILLGITEMQILILVYGLEKRIILFFCYQETHLMNKVKRYLRMDKAILSKWSWGIRYSKIWQNRLQIKSGLKR